VPYAYNHKKADSFLGISETDAANLYETSRNDLGESYHSQIESTAINYINLLRSKDSAFLNDTDSRNVFYFYLANQYTRTKRMRDATLESIANGNDKPPCYALSKEDAANLHYFHISFTSNSIGFALSCKGYYAKFLQNDSDAPFITSDQPIINIYADYKNSATPNKLALYYPLTPNLAVLFHNEGQPEHNGEFFVLNAEQVEAYNQMIISASLQQIYGNNAASLKRYLINK